LSRQRTTQAESFATVTKSIMAFFKFIEFCALNYKLYKRDERDKLKQHNRKFLFDKLRLPLLGFTHAHWEIERNPY
jgi:hypothetical protein